MTTPSIKLSEEELRDLFNREYLPRLEKNELEQEPWKISDPSPDRKAALGTKSVWIRVWDRHTRKLVAVFHGYRLVDGSYLAPTDPPNLTARGTGKPDPKRVLFEEQWYHC